MRLLGAKAARGAGKIVCVHKVIPFRDRGHVLCLGLLPPGIEPACGSTRIQNNAMIVLLLPRREGLRVLCVEVCMHGGFVLFRSGVASSIKNFLRSA
jgi:hypothetical protein